MGNKIMTTKTLLRVSTTSETISIMTLKTKTIYNKRMVRTWGEVEGIIRKMSLRTVTSRIDKEKLQIKIIHMIKGLLMDIDTIKGTTRHPHRLLFLIR